MKIVVFGCGPMPCEPQYAVTAPGARSWQIVQTVLSGLDLAEVSDAEMVVVNLDGTPRQPDSIPMTFDVPLDCGDTQPAAALHRRVF